MAVIDVASEITGIVWKIVKPAGESVDVDEAIILLESMKMEIPVEAPNAGIVTEILVAEGDTVTEGTVVARLEI